MKIDLKVKGLDEVLRKLDRMPGDVEKVTERVLKQAARGVAAECGRMTGKGGLSEAQGARQEKKIASEVRALFPDPDHGGRIYELIAAKDEVLAKQFYAAWKADDTKRQTALMRKAGVSRSLDPVAHRKVRDSGGVKGSTVPIAVIAQSRQGSYIRRKRQLVGLVKGGWFAAGKSLGGRQRTQTPEGKSLETFPGYVRRHGKSQGIGGSSWKPGRAASLTIWNAVRHVGEVLSSASRRAAVDAAARKLARAFAAELKHLNRKRK